MKKGFLMNVIFWDFDGTLVYSKHLWSGSMYRAICEIDPGTTVSFEDIRVCNQKGFTWQTPDNDHTALTGEAWWEFMNAHIYRSFCECGANHDHAVEATRLTRTILKHPDNYHLYDDTLDTLAKAREKGYRHVLLSNNYPELEDILEQIGLLSFLDGVIVSALEGYDKPRRELFEIARKRYPAERYYMVGDNPSADVIGGNRSNMTTVLVHNGYHPDADYCFDDLHGLLTILE